MGTCVHCGEQIVWHDDDWMTLDGRTFCPLGGVHQLAPPKEPSAD